MNLYDGRGEAIVYMGGGGKQNPRWDIAHFALPVLRLCVSVVSTLEYSL